jgi:hypothetical protein
VGAVERRTRRWVEVVGDVAYGDAGGANERVLMEAPPEVLSRETAGMAVIYCDRPCLDLAGGASAPALSLVIVSAAERTSGHLADPKQTWPW